MHLSQILILSVIQGLAEMLPVSSSAHVILAQKLMGLDPSAPDLTFLLVMLHTGTMFAALVYFARRWKERLRQSEYLKMVILATVCTGVLGLGLKLAIEKILLEHFFGRSKGEVESLFNNLPLIGASLLVAGALIIYAGGKETSAPIQDSRRESLNTRQSIWTGISQALCLPFRGLSRSGTTISTSLLTGVRRDVAEEFSFALAVILTPPVILLELRRLMKTLQEQNGLNAPFDWIHALQPGCIGMVFSFIAGLVALRFLSRMLEHGRWRYFGYYCVAFSAVVFGCSFLT